MSEYPFHYDLPKTAPLSASEISIQAACKLRVETEFKAIFASVPNGTFIASKAGRGKAKREGLAKGFPDAVIVGTGKNAGKIAFAEFKARRQLSLEQREILTALHENKHDVGVFRSQDTLAAKLREWGWL
jgi:hypothetical protein